MCDPIYPAPPVTKIDMQSPQNLNLHFLYAKKKESIRDRKKQKRLPIKADVNFIHLDDSGPYPFLNRMYQVKAPLKLLFEIASFSVLQDVCPYSS